MITFLANSNIKCLQPATSRRGNWLADVADVGILIGAKGKQSKSSDINPAHQ